MTTATPALAVRDGAAHRLVRCHAAPTPHQGVSAPLLGPERPAHAHNGKQPPQGKAATQDDPNRLATLQPFPKKEGTQKTLLTSKTDLFCPAANSSPASFCILSEFSFFNGIYYLLSGGGDNTHTPCGGQRTSCRSWVSPPATQIPGTSPCQARQQASSVTEPSCWVLFSL